MLNLVMDDISPSQPSLKGSRVPPGHILVNSKHQGTDLIKQFQSTDVKVILQDGLGIVDFYPSSTTAVIWLPEELLVRGSDSLKQRLLKLAKGKCCGIVIAHVTQLSKQYFKELQEFSSIDLNIPTIPVNSSLAMIKVVTHIVYNQGNQNPILKRQRGVNFDDAVMATLKSFPGIGEKKVKQILTKYTSLYELGNASIEDLESLVGCSTAANIRKFLDCKATEKTPNR